MNGRLDAEASATAVRLAGVRVQAAGRTLLAIDRLELHAGERVAVVGPNGAGKSTLLRLLAGLAVGASGEVQVLGRAPQDVPRQAVGLLMQGLHLVPRLSARENTIVGALARLRGGAAWRSCLRMYPAALVREADAALTALGLAERAGTRSDRLSGGERQKVALARLQLQAPRLVLADEPTAALDPVATAQVCAALVALAAPAGRMLVCAVHDLDLLPALATRVLGLARGQLQWDLPLAQVSRDRLQALYAQAGGAAPQPAAVPRAPAAHALTAPAA